MPVRSGLARLEGVESISERCNRQNGTGELRMRDGRLLDPRTLAEHILSIQVGARLRALEATVEGTLEKIDGKPYLRMNGSQELLALTPVTRKVQIDAPNKKPIPPTRKEATAYKGLTAKWKGKSQSIRITGPLRNSDSDKSLVLEVREFKWLSVKDIRVTAGGQRSTAAVTFDRQR